MKLQLSEGLIYVDVRVIYDYQEVIIPEVIVDTGSATTLFSADLLAQIGVMPLPDDILYRVRGVGGAEVVFSRNVTLQIGDQVLSGFEVEIGGLDYGFAVNGILGMDFLLQTHAVVDLNVLELTFACG